MVGEERREQFFDVEPDVLFNTRDDTVSAVSKSAPQVKVAKGTVCGGYLC